MEHYNHESFINSSMVSDLNNAVVQSRYDLEGNCLYKHFSNFVEFEGSEWDSKLILRQNLFKIAKRCKNGIEIGFNAGHSAAIYFTANPQLYLLSFDICHHGYTIPCASILGNKYNCNIELVIGNSLKTLPDYEVTEKYDFIHIDGGHGEHMVESDLIHSKKFAHKNSYLIIDDINMPHIEKVVEKYISKGEIVEIDYEEENLKKNFWHKIYYFVI